MSLNIDLHATVEIIRFLEVSKSQCETILDTLPGFFLIIDSKATILRGNRNFADYMSVDFENLIGQQFDQRIGASWAEFSSKITQMKRLGHTAVEFELLVADDNEGQINFLWNVCPLKIFGREHIEPDNYLIVGRKITLKES